MLKKLLIATALTLAAATSAYADQCVDTMKTVERALAGETVAPGTKEKANDLLSQAKEKQAAGDNEACVTLLTEAAKVLTSE